MTDSLAPPSRSTEIKVLRTPPKPAIVQSHHQAYISIRHAGVLVEAFSELRSGSRARDLGVELLALPLGERI